MNLSLSTDRVLEEQKLLLLEELQKRQSLAINKYVPDSQAERNQLSFHTSSARYRVMTGGNQSGKTASCAAEIAYWALDRHPYLKLSRKPKKIFVLSAEYRLIFEGVWRHLRPDGAQYGGLGFLPQDRIKKYGPKIPGYDIPTYVEVYWGECPVDKSGKQLIESWPFSRIDFISAEGGEAARRRIQSAAIDFAAIDEEIDEVLWAELKMRLLALDGRVIITATLVRSEEWLLELEEQYDEGDKRVFWVRLNTEKNQYLSVSAKEEILSDMSEEMRYIRVLGGSRRKFGLIYSSFSEAHICKPFTIPRDWIRYRIIDPGFRRTAVLWLAHPPGNTDRIVGYRELYLKEASLVDVVRAINDLEGYTLVGNTRQGNEESEICTGYIDPAAYKHLADGSPCIAYQLAAFYDMPQIPAQNPVEAGIETVRRALEINEQTGIPIFQIFENCYHFLSERRRYKIKQDTSGRNISASQDMPVKKDDHLMDAWRYGMVAIRGLPNFTTISRKKHGYQYGTLSLADRYAEEVDRLKNGSKACHPYLGTEW